MSTAKKLKKKGHLFTTLLIKSHSMTNPLLLDQINAFPKFGENLLETL